MADESEQESKRGTDRRTFFKGAAAAGAALAVGGAGTAAAFAGGSSRRPARAATGLEISKPLSPAERLALRRDPTKPVGTDLYPQIEHIVVVMMENHSFDNILGMSRHGDGFTFNSHGQPTNSNPDGHGKQLRAFHMPTPCQFSGKPSQSWNASHHQYDDGSLQGFVTSASGPVAMGYWTAKDMPFTNSLARTFPIADRWFCSVLGQTYPNRRYMLAGTSLGMINDTFDGTLPPNGTILNQLQSNHIPWRNYHPSSSTPGVYVWMGLIGHQWIAGNCRPIDAFYTHARKGTLPAVAFVDPNFSHSSEENPQDIQYGDVFLSNVVNAVMDGPKWMSTLLIWTYDEHGGYYDHVAPPTAVPPDDVPPDLQSGDVKGTFGRYGFRVPAGVVSPYAIKGHVAHEVFDHTSILKLIENKWNLPPMTRRDADAADPAQYMVDFSSPPTFNKPPHLSAPANPALRAGCLTTGPGTIP